MDGLVLAIKGAAIYALSGTAMIAVLLGSARLLLGPAAFTTEGLRDANFAMMAGGGIFLAALLAAGAGLMVYVGR
jgi:hypothetical protein